MPSLPTSGRGALQTRLPSLLSPDLQAHLLQSQELSSSPGESMQFLPRMPPPSPARAPCTEDAPSPLRPSQPLTVLRADGPSLQFLQCSFDGSFSAGFNFHTHTQVSSPFKRPSSAPSAPPGTSLCLILSLQSNFSKGLAPLSVLHPPLLLTPQSFPAWPVSGLVGGDHPAGWCFSVLNCCQPLPQPHSFPDPQLPQEAQRPGEERLRLPPE